MMSPEDWIKHYVQPALDDYRLDLNSRHKAMSSAILAHHVSDRVFHYYKQHDPAALGGAKTESAFLKGVVDQEQVLELELIWDVADASKHHFLRPADRDRWVKSSTGAIEGFLIGGTGDYLLEPAVQSVINFWKQWRIRHPIKGIDRP